VLLVESIMMASPIAKGKLPKKKVMNNIQSKALQMAKDYGLDADAMTRFADLVSELGELGKELVKSTSYGKEPLKANDAIKMELGDVIFALALLANETGLDIEECFEKTYEKCRQRFETKGHIGS